MKKFIMILLVLSLGTELHAQRIAKNAIGIRIGDNDGLGGEVSYQRYLRENNRLEFDLGWRNGTNHDAVKLVGLYQWVMPIENRFQWYVGAGAGVGAFNHKNDDNGNFALIAGDIGIEYNFEIPLLIALDIRPEFGFNDRYSDDLDLDLAFSIRYQF